MTNNIMFSVLINAVIMQDGKILITKRSMNEAHQPGSWTVPGGKIETNLQQPEVFDVVEATLKKEIREETGLEISQNILLIANNTFTHTKGYQVLALVFLCNYQSGVAQAREDTSEVAWISASEMNYYTFAPNVERYLAKGFAITPYLQKPSRKK